MYCPPIDGWTTSWPRRDYLIHQGIIIIAVNSNESTAASTWTGTEGLPIYPAPIPPDIEHIFIVERRLCEKFQAQRRELHFLPLKSPKSAPHIKPPIFSRRLEGGRAQRHRQKWKMRRQKEGLV